MATISQIAAQWLRWAAHDCLDRRPNVWPAYWPVIRLGRISARSSSRLWCGLRSLAGHRRTGQSGGYVTAHRPPRSIRTSPRPIGLSLIPPLSSSDALSASLSRFDGDVYRRRISHRRACVRAGERASGCKCVRACVRAGVRTCGRASARACKRAWGDVHASAHAQRFQTDHIRPNASLNTISQSPKWSIM